MNPQSIDVYVILDRSGSMAPLANTVVQETNSLFDNLRADPEIATVTLVMFESEDAFDCVLDRLPINRLGKLSSDAYQPGTGTPLWDAIGSTVDLATRHQAAAQRRVLVAVVTDGEENDSVQYTSRRLYGKLRRRLAAGWQFLYLGAGRTPSPTQPRSDYPLTPSCRGTPTTQAPGRRSRR